MGAFADTAASASLRHLRDAQGLAVGVAASPDQAWHLVGFAPECARKAGLSKEWQGKAIGHQSELTRRSASWILDLDPAARRRLSGIPTIDPTPGWSPSNRYERTGWLALSPFNLPAALKAADTFVVTVLASLWSAGDLSSDILRERQ